MCNQHPFRDLTPHQMRFWQAQEIFRNQNLTIKLAKDQHPESWESRPTRMWSAIREVLLNPDRKLRPKPSTNRDSNVDTKCWFHEPEA